MTSKKIMITPGSNRNEAFNSLILPRCSNLVKAIGQRMAYEAAEASDAVSPEMLKLFEAACMMEDPAWYVQHKKISTSAIHRLHAEAVGTLLPRLDAMLQDTQAAPWATAPILREQDWEDFLGGLPSFSSGDSTPVPPPSGRSTPGSDTTLQEEWDGAKHDAKMIAEQHSVTVGKGEKKSRTSLKFDADMSIRRRWKLIFDMAH